MIIITGLRSGTALIMQTCELLGKEVVGYKFHDEFSHQELNPKGYYFLSQNEIRDGLNTTEYKGKCVKLGGGHLAKTDPKYIDKVIYCKRNPNEVKKSMLKLLKADYDMIGLEPTGENAEKAYDANLLLTIPYLKDNNIPTLIVYYEDMILNPVKTINLVKDFLDVDTSIELALLNVDKRSVSCLQPQ